VKRLVALSFLLSSVAASQTLVMGPAYTSTTGLTAEFNKSCLPVYFEQVDSTSFFGGVPVKGNQAITISVTLGGAIIYGATTDSVTNDPSVQFAETI